MTRLNITAITLALVFSIGAMAGAKAETKLSPTEPSAPSVALVENNKIQPVEPGLELARNHGCFTCHALDRMVIGPAWRDVAARYRGEANAEDLLVQKVSKGGKGVWRKDLVMPPFSPHLKEADIRTLVKYILSLK